VFLPVEEIMPSLIDRDVFELLIRSKTKSKFADLDFQERQAYQRVHTALEQLAARAVDALGGPEKFAIKLTSGFFTQSGIRGSLPKDLWFATYNKRNFDAFVGMPQVFVIVSGRGLEVGLAAAIHPSDFSQKLIKDRVKQAAPSIFAAFPPPNSSAAMALDEDLSRSGHKWFFRRKTRLDPGVTDFPSLDAWLAFLQSEEGAQWAGGSISFYLHPEDLDRSGLDLETMVRDTAAIFAPIMRMVVPTGSVPVLIEPPSRGAAPEEAQDTNQEEVIRPAFEEFLIRFPGIRSSGPYHRHPELWSLMGRLEEGLTGMPALQAHLPVRVTWIVGGREWANVPQITLVNERETPSVHRGTYCAFLFPQDMSGVYLTLTQGVTDLVSVRGRTNGRRELQRRAEWARRQVPNLAGAGFFLDEGIDLRTDAAAGTDYEHSTIAYKFYPASAVPPDAEIATDLEALLDAYACILAASGLAEENTPAIEEKDVPRVWLWSPGEGAGHWDELYEHGQAAIGWDELGDLSRFGSVDDITDILSRTYPQHAQPTTDAQSCHDFVRAMRTGDLVFARRGHDTILGYGHIIGDYTHDPTRPALHNARAVRWIGRGAWTSPYQLPLKTLTDITGSAELVEALQTLVGAGRANSARLVPAPERKPFSVEEAMVGLFMPRVTFELALDIWRPKRNLILQGAPGVGKSFVARRLAYALMGYEDPSRVRTVQFHQAYAYEDFVQGFRPNRSGSFALREGVFLDFCRRALADPDEIYVFIVDEVNRGNLSKILGELMLLIEPDKRSPEWAVKLAYAEEPDERFYVPANLFLLGMMNTADRSLAVVDYALRRRFAFVTVPPGFGEKAFTAHLEGKGVSEATIEQICGRMGELNQAISADRTNLGPGFCIGHSFFSSPPALPPANGSANDAAVAEERWYRRVVETEIVPLLEEYWFDDPTKAAEWHQQLLA
jgi:hypothetical protein